MATYYGSELNDAIVRYFRRFDIEGISFGGYRLGGREEALYTTSLPALDEVGGEQVYRYCRAGFLKLAGGREVDWRGRAEFLTLAAHAMRGILVNYVAARQAQKRGGGRTYVTLDGVSDPSTSYTFDLLCLDEALRAFEECHERESRILEMRFFGGLTVEEIAAILEVSHRTVQRDLHYARNWLFRRIEHGCGSA